MARGEDAVWLDKVSKIYDMGEVKVRALTDVELSIPAGDFVVFLGPSGSGKTTLMNIIGGLDSATSGRAFVHGREVTGLSQDELTEYRRKDVGFIFQFFNLMPTLTARENVQLIADLVHSSEDATALLDSVGLGEYVDHFPSQLSGGQQQRVAIARALVKRPRLLLADEPTGNLDYDTSREVLSVIREMAREDNTTVIAVTHDESITERGEMVVRLRSGHIVSVERKDDG
jgi:putative ABC transport system ATP-binding protein